MWQAQPLCSRCCFQRRWEPLGEALDGSPSSCTFSEACAFWPRRSCLSSGPPHPAQGFANQAGAGVGLYPSSVYPSGHRGGPFVPLRDAGEVK